VVFFNCKMGRYNESGLLSDLYEEQTRRAAIPEASLFSNSGDEEEEAEGEDGDASDVEDAPEFATIGDFTPPDGWIVLPQPAQNEAAWANAKKKYKWGAKRLAHIWDAPLGWQQASFSERAKGLSVFYYASDKLKCSHHLPLETYGVDGHWVILERAE
jgi:hypothetical protein